MKPASVGQRPTWRMFTIVPTLLLAGLVAGAQENDPARGMNVYSREKEAALGASLAKELRKNSTVLDSIAAHEYLERLGRQLAPHFPGERTYTFGVIADDADTNQLHEPRTLPGGYIFVPAGLFFSAQDESEFVGMLAHAMAHVVAGHGTSMAKPGQIANVVSSPLIYMYGWKGTGGGGTSMPSGFVKFARANELEADRLAAGAMARAGYDPAALTRYIRREQIEPAGKAEVLSPLPPRETRLVSLDAVTAALPPATYSEGPDFARVRDEVRTLTHKQQGMPPKPSLRR